MSRAFAAALFGIALLAGSTALAAKEKLAYFQPKNIYRSGLRQTHIVALTFDDGPNYYTPAVLDELERLGVKGTFFIVGKMARAYPGVLARIAAEGHLLANHSATHPFLGERYAEHPELLLAQIRDVDDEISPLMPTGAKYYFRAPYGSWRPSYAEVLNADPELRKYVGPIYWDEGGQITISDDGYVMSSSDWDCWHRGWEAETCAKGYLREIRRKNGGIVLLHCIHSQSAALVADIVPPLIDEGYTFVRVDQISGYRQYETPPEEFGPAIASNVSHWQGVPK